MRTMLLSLFLLFTISAMQAQTVIQLGEARISYNPDAIIVNSNINSVGFTIKENYIGEFSKNPIQFMKQNFDFQELLSSIDNKDDFNGYLVTFRSTKGFLEANYTSEGKLKDTKQMFIDKALPNSLSKQLYSENAGWTMVSNKYLASGKEDRIDSEVYRIKLENGSKSRRVKLVPGATVLGIANN
tara:strand:+ start:1716 stop:2270 length:555 start_codon:yes stop_codon:yes gene_type:complete